MVEAFVTQHPALVIPIVAILCVTILFLVGIVSHSWRQVRKLEVESALKQDMLNRGLSPAEIERVLLASVGGPVQPPSVAITDNEYYLVEKLLDEGRPIEEIERVVRAFKGGKAEVHFPRELSV